MPEQLAIDGSVIVGAKRSTTNIVINRNHYPLGKSAYYNPALHKEAAVYGTLIKRDPEGACSIMYNWTSATPQQKEIDHGRNFMKLNKMAVSAGASGCHEVSQFRQTTDARIVSRPGDVLKLKNQVPVSLDPNRVFGLPNQGADASIEKLVRNGYEREWVNDQLQREAKLKKKEESKAALRQTASSTRSTRGQAADKKQLSLQCSLPSIHSR